MLAPFFALAAQSPTRQQAFRRLVAAHLILLTGGVAAVAYFHRATGVLVLGNLLLLAGIVEGAVLLGWRLTQLPKSQALEFLLVTPLRPRWVFVSEALVGLGRLALVTLSGLPVLGYLAGCGCLDPLDLIPLLLFPFLWGAVTGLGLTVWAYESLVVRRIGERVALGLIVLYLLVGVLAGEHLKRWLKVLSEDGQRWVVFGVDAIQVYNPFAVLVYWLQEEPAEAWQRVAGVGLAGALLAGLFLLRAAWRLQGHFQDEHYRPALDRSARPRPAIGDRPLSWWAVRRVTRYSGRINLWLAGGFGVLYALYILAGANWPPWLGRAVFLTCDGWGGVPGLTTALVLLAAVPAAFQYGLWDASAQDRCRRLELLLLTELHGQDFWNAAAAAAWKRGRGYFAVAVLLWGAAVVAGRVTTLQATAALASGVLLWALYFALGFRAFARGAQANGLGMLLTLGLPLVAFLCTRAGWPGLVDLVPPGNVYRATVGKPDLWWLAGPLLVAVATLMLARRTLAHCTRDLRRWYEQHHGRKVIS